MGGAGQVSVRWEELWGRKQEEPQGVPGTAGENESQGLKSFRGNGSP